MTEQTDIEIPELERTRARAIIDRDFEKFTQIAHPALRYTHSSGVTDTLASYVNACRDGTYVYESIDLSVEEVVATDATAISYGHMLASLSVDGKPKELDYEYLSVWSRVDLTWRFLSFCPRPTT